MRAICSASGRGLLIKAGGGVSAGSGRFSVLSCSGSPLPDDDAEVVLAPTGVGGASPSAEVDGLSLSDRAAPALCTSVGRCPAMTLADEDINSILADNTKRAIQGKEAMQVM